MDSIIVKAPKENGTIILKRTFNMKMPWGVERYWRIVGPKKHRNYQSDLSLSGLKDWGIIQ